MFTAAPLLKGEKPLRPLTPAPDGASKGFLVSSLAALESHFVELFQKLCWGYSRRRESAIPCTFLALHLFRLASNLKIY